MPRAAPKICSYAGCTALAHEGTRCDNPVHKIISSWNENEKQKGNRHERGYGYKWEKIRAKVLKRDRYLCCQCLVKQVYKAAKDVDHIVARCDGGSDTLDNLQSLCQPCHRKKTAMHTR